MSNIIYFVTSIGYLENKQCLEIFLSIQTGRWKAIAITYQAHGKEVVKRE